MLSPARQRCKPTHAIIQWSCRTTISAIMLYQQEMRKYFLHPPSRQRRLLMVTPHTSIRRGSLDIGYEMIANDMISFQEHCGRLEVSLCYRLTTWDRSVVGVSPTPITVSGMVPSGVIRPVVPVPLLRTPFSPLSAWVPHSSTTRR